MSWEYGQIIWDELLSDIGNEIGVAGLMGNLLAESGLLPYRIEGDFSTGYVNSLNYTANVDNGTITEYDFVNSYTGYGLAQWTFNTRKQALYNMKISMGVSIGNVNLAINYLLEELHNGYLSVYNELLVSTSIRQASDVVLFDFENPADQSESVQIYRASLGQQIYDEYHGIIPPPIKKKKLPLYMYLRSY